MEVVRELNIVDCCNAFVAAFNVVHSGRGANTSGRCVCKLPKKGSGHNTLLPQLTAEGADVCVLFWLSINTFKSRPIRGALISNAICMFPIATKCSLTQ